MKTITSLSEYKKTKKINKYIVISFQILLFVLFLICWEILVNIGYLNEFLLSKPSSIFNLTVYYISNNLLWKHLSISIIETVIGLIIGTISGLLIATILYLIPFLDKILDPYLVVLNALPKTALAPILIIWAGTNIKGIILVSVSLSLIITIISALSYFKNVDKDLIKMMKAYKANQFQILFNIVYPSNIANIFSIIKVNIGMSWVGVIIGEFLVSREGIGYLVVYGGQVFKLDLVMMGVSILAIVALIMYQIINIIEKLINQRTKK